MNNDFDNAAKNYDADFTYSEIGKAQRSRVHHFLSAKILSEKALQILEINCGTGEDALFFANKGHAVIATDISENMINLATKKDRTKSVQFFQQDINALSSLSFSNKFDLLFSNFGGLNCLSASEISSFLSNSIELLKPNGKLVLVVMPKDCIWERFYFLVKGRIREARRRRRNKEATSVNVDGTKVSTWYYNPKDLISLAKKRYNTLLIKPIGIAIPPSYLEPYFSNKKSVLNFLIRIEKMLISKFWASYADHYLIVFQKK